MLTKQLPSISANGDQVQCRLSGFIDTNMTRGSFGKLAESMGLDMETLCRMFSRMFLKEPGTRAAGGICTFLASDDTLVYHGAVIRWMRVDRCRPVPLAGEEGLHRAGK